MTSSDDRFAVPHEAIASKVLGDEAVIINLETGTYYSLTAVGAAAWDLLDRGLSRDEIVSHLAARYDAEAERLRADLDALIGELLQEGLLAPSNGAAISPPPPPGAENAGRLDYTAPALDVYRDMADLLAIDPPQPGLADLSWEQTETGQSSS